jgi:hypothetical protein
MKRRRRKRRTISFFMTTATALLMNVGNSSPFSLSLFLVPIFFSTGHHQHLSELSKHTRLWPALMCSAVCYFVPKVFMMSIYMCDGWARERERERESIVAETYSQRVYTASWAHISVGYIYTFYKYLPGADDAAAVCCWQGLFGTKGDTQRDDHQFDLFNEYHLRNGDRVPARLQQ